MIGSGAFATAVTPAGLTMRRGVPQTTVLILELEGDQMQQLGLRKTTNLIKQAIVTVHQVRLITIILPKRAIRMLPPVISKRKS